MKACAELIRSDLQSFEAYSSARKEAGQTDTMLNANERAWPNQLYPELYRYPEQQPPRIIKALSTFYNVNENQLLVSRGSDEGIELLIRLFCMPTQEAIIICPPTFGMYAISAKLQAVACKEVPLRAEENFAVDVQGILNAWDPKTKIVFLCSPNNPTGNLIDISTVKTLCQQLENKAIICVDEAYIEYANADSFSKLINQYENLVILRTLSKAFGLAGARCGITIANPFIIKKLQAVMAPYPIPATLIEIIERNMSPDMRRNLHEILQDTKDQREKLCQSLQTISCIQWIKTTEANFVLIKVNRSEKLLEHCKREGILIRDMNKKLGLKNVIRITVGSPEDNQRLIECMRQYNE